MKVQPSAVVKKLFMQGKVVTINQEIDFETAEEIALEFNCICEHEEVIDVIAELLKEEKASFTEPGFWDTYRELKATNPMAPEVQKVKHFFKRKSASEKQSINYPIQATGSMCLRVALVYFFEYLRSNNLLFKVKICVTPYDEVNCEAPEDIAEEVAQTLYDCMVRAGSYFCTRCKLDADISRLADGTLPTYWVH